MHKESKLGLSYVLQLLNDRNKADLGSLLLSRDSLLSTVYDTYKVIIMYMYSLIESKTTLRISCLSTLSRCYNSMSCASSSLNSDMLDSLSELSWWPWSRSASSVANRFT